MTPTHPPRNAGLAEKLADHLELTKPRITLMVVLTTGLGFLLGREEEFSPGLLAAALVGTGLLSAGGSALNHFWERDTDALMERTAGRPLPAGRLGAGWALTFGLVIAVAGCSLLATRVNLLTAGLGLLAFLSYVFIYTPMKKLTPLSTLVGAIPGALPPMMGWTAARDDLAAGAWILFGILFLWQLPHFLAIAWLCREDYARAGLPTLPVVEPDGRSTARQALLWGAALLPVSLSPVAIGLAGDPYLVGATVLGIGFFVACAAFSRAVSDRAARHLLLASVIYLPAVLAVMAVDRLV